MRKKSRKDWWYYRERRKQPFLEGDLIMKITICGSMTFAKEMLYYKELLEKRGHHCLIPFETERYATGGGNP